MYEFYVDGQLRVAVCRREDFYYWKNALPNAVIKKFGVVVTEFGQH